jgi:hypothetical protein
VTAGVLLMRDPAIQRLCEVCATVGRDRPAVTSLRLRRGDPPIVRLCAACREAERACRLGILRAPDGRLQLDGHIPAD